ncbi:nicotinate (nicotinamide) nucleotide adenylyltransferase [Moraxella marmotae]|uniref:nicotinate (nicotinamide) nucleotide adenylyltransferase n=1 Tax=Moraxella marmotae TaxID=3344520 RepID=UPI0035F38115
MKTIRIFLGGSFDPIHHAHLQMALAVYRTLQATTQQPISIHLLPTAGNPFKNPPTPAIHRIAMMQRAIAPLLTQGIAIGIDTRELEQPPPVYTIDTVAQLCQSYADDMLIFVIGGDSLASLYRWKSYDALIRQIKIWAFERIGDDGQIDADIAKRCTDDLDKFLATDNQIFIDKTPIAAMSSSQIRTLIAQNHQQAAATLIDDDVLAYIMANHLYQDAKTVV